MTFDPPIWRPLFNFIRNELLPLLGGGGGAQVAAQHAFIEPLMWENVVGEADQFELVGNQFTYVQWYATDEPNERRTTVLLDPTFEYNYVINFGWIDSGGEAKVYFNGVLNETFDLYSASPDSAGQFSGSIDIATFGGSPLLNITILCDTKNASSTGFEMRLGNMWITPVPEV